MTLEFPNRMRMLNAEAGIITFSGYDRITEIRFSLPIDVLAKINGQPFASNAAALASFDSLRDRIQTAAANTHARSHGTFHVLEASRF
jgi:Protein of unknown function (DUF1488)